MSNLLNVIIIGSGPAAYTAGIYTARANLEPLIIEGSVPGGQLITTTTVENYPGFPDGVDGYELMQLMRKQSINSGCKTISEDVIEIDTNTKPYKVFTTNQEFTTNSIIIATGATAKKLELPNGERLWGRGISACAVCDGALPIFRNKPIAVVGGGDTACEEAMHLSKFGSIVYLIVRRDELRASKVMQNRVLNNNKIQVLFNTEIIDVFGDKLLKSIKIINNLRGYITELEVNGLFYAIGHVPNTDFLKGQIDLNNNGYIKASDTKTNIEGVFACGDVQDYVYRQAVTAAGSGCQAALECERYLLQN